MSDENNTLLDVRLDGGSFMERWMFADELFGLLNLRKRSALIHGNFEDYTVSEVWREMLSHESGKKCLYDRMKKAGIYLVDTVFTRIFESDYSEADDPC